MAGRGKNGHPTAQPKGKRKKYSINVEDGKMVSVEVDGIEYKDPEDIPNADDRDMLQMLIMGGPDLEPEPFPDAKPSPMPKIVLGVFGGVAALMLVITVVAAVMVSRSMAREAAVSGRVVDLVPVPGSDGATFYRPLVDFIGVDNERHIVQVGNASRPPSHRVGQPVQIRYDPTNPESARIASFWGNVGQYTVSLITGILAIAFVGATVLAWWINKE